MAILPRPQRLSAVKRIFGDTCHAEPSRSAAADEYVWKEDTRVENTQFELGNKPLRRNNPSDWENIWNLAKEGKIDEIPYDVRFHHYRTIKNIQKDFLLPSACEKTVKVFWGRSGAGKSRRAWEEAGIDAYPKDPNTKYWDGYQEQEKVVIDEFRGSIHISHMLRWLDRYPVRHLKNGMLSAGAHLLRMGVKHYFKPKSKQGKQKMPTETYTSTGDMNKVIYKKKKVNRRKLKKQKRFATAVTKVIENELPKQQIVFQESGNQVTSTGSQSYFQIVELDVTHINGILKELNQAATSGNSDPGQKYRVLQYHYDGMYTNSSNTTAIMDWYTVVPRTDNINDAQTDMGQYLAQTGGEGSTTANFPQAAINSTQGVYGLTPFNASSFCSKWKILSTRRIILQPGETKEFRFYHKGQKEISLARTSQNGTYYKSLKGITKNHLIRLYGQPVHDSTNENLVSVSPVRLDWVASSQFLVQAIPPPPALNSGVGRNQIFVSQVFPSVPVPKTLEEFNPSNVVTANPN